MFFTSLTCRSQTETRWKCPGFLSLFLKHVSMDIINFSIFYTLFSMRGRQKQLPAPWRSLSRHKCEGQQIIKGTFKRFMLGKILIITFLYFCYCNLKSWTLSPLQLKWKVKPANVNPAGEPVDTNRKHLHIRTVPTRLQLNLNTAPVSQVTVWRPRPHGHAHIHIDTPIGHVHDSPALHIKGQNLF